ncbi:MAG: 4-hydroxy-3-methylbut-2-enyl diphosphate reductase [Kiritimatiellae bacterium]|nr:4-hydroxy-3-methylbut-2-enyl diphosphate reductase [Kiritimatiellia bacterium]
MRRLIVVQPHGFCSGVARAIRTAEALLAKHRSESVFCLHEIVHNRQVVERLSQQGMVFVKSVEDVPPGALLLFSAHGVSPAVRARAAERNLRVIDATCPFVAKVHAEVRRYVNEGRDVICIGHRNHDEVVGVSGEAPDHVRIVEDEDEIRSLPSSDRPLAVVTQTTLSMDSVGGMLSLLSDKFQNLLLPDATEICYATQNRQEAVRTLAETAPLVFVLGSRNSSNSLRLVETAQRASAEARLISETGDLEDCAFPAACVVGLTSGASTPESFLHEVISILRERFGFEAPEEFTAVEENGCVFRLPPEVERGGGG